MTTNSIFLWASQNVGWTIGLSIALLVGVWKLARWVQRVDDTVIDVQELKKSVAELTARMDALTARMDELTARVDALTERVDALTKRMDEFLGNGPNSFVTRATQQIISILQERGVAFGNSPLTLNKKGEDIARRIKADAIVEYYIGRVVESTKGMDAYDIQKFCFEFAYYEMKKDLQDNHAEDYAHMRYVAYDTDLTVESVLRMAVGIKLRDKVLQRHGMDKDPTGIAPC